MENNEINTDIQICYCLGTFKSEIVKTIQVFQLKTIDEVQENGIAATYCGRCIPDIESILNQVNHR